MTGAIGLEPTLKGVPEWLGRMRREAYEHFAATGFPTTKDEDWKYTSVAPIARTSFAAAPEVSDQEIRQVKIPDIRARLRLVFVNGHFQPALSRLGSDGAKVKIRPMGQVLREAPDVLQGHYGRYVNFRQNIFAALNTALGGEGAVVEVGPHAVVEDPVHLVFVMTDAGSPVVAHPRNLVLVRRGSQFQIVEHYLGPAEACYWTNAVTEIVVEEGALVDHYRIQDEGVRAYHVGLVQAWQGRDSVYRSHVVSLGAILNRADLNSVLDGEGAECVLNGLYAIDGQRHTDHHTLLDHARPNCTSRELYKGLLDGNGVGVFNGKIIVRKDAQKTNAIQNNRNLLLSPDAVINSKPQLEIFADDVRCTHGATVGQLDREAMFYLLSRGIDKGEARELLTQAFAGEVVEAIRWDPLKEHLRQRLHEMMRGESGGTT